MRRRFYPDEQTAEANEKAVLEHRIQQTGTQKEESYIYLNKATGWCMARDELGGKMITIAGLENAEHNGNYHLSQGLCVERR